METKTLSSEIEYVHEYDVKQSKKDVHPAVVQEVIIVPKVKQFIEDLKDWLELHQDTLITGGTVWEVIKEKAGKELTE